jgi:hypothetical protein
MVGLVPTIHVLPVDDSKMWMLAHDENAADTNRFGNFDIDGA